MRRLAELAGIDANNDGWVPLDRVDIDFRVVFALAN
jgi:hypothetical protein